MSPISFWQAIPFEIGLMVDAKCKIKKGSDETVFL